MEVLTYLLKSSVVLALFLGVYHLLLRRETLFVWNRHFLLSGIFISFLLPFWEITQTQIIEIPASFSNTDGILPTNAPTYAAHEVIATNSIDYNVLLTLVYTLGVSILFLYIGYQAWKLIRFIKGHPKMPIKGIWHVITQSNLAPFSFLRYIVYNPKLHSEEELKMILQHETIHVRDRHSYDMIIAQILVIFHWFNPLAWWYRKAITENLEFLADHRTLPKVPCSKTYQLALVRTSSVTTAPMLTNSFYQSFIKKRIVMLNKNQSNRLNALKTFAILPLLALFFYSFNVTTENKYVEVPMPAEAEVTMESGDPVTSLKPITRTNTMANTAAARQQDGNQNVQIPEKKNDKEVAVIATFNDYEKTINKNTSDSELEAIKKELKEKYGMNFSYSRQRNGAGEIVSLSMNYSGNGKNGNYQVTDEEGIEEFTFYITEEGKSGFYSEANEIRQEERRAEMEERRSQMREEMKARRQEMDERRVELDERREEMEIRRKEMEKRREYRLQEMEEQREDRLEELEERREAQRVRLAEIHEVGEHEIYRVRKSPGGEILVVDELGPNGHYEIHDDTETVVVRGQEGSFGVITKNTSDSELEKLKTVLAKKGIEFNYRNVKRNTRGEIKGIKFTVKDAQGKSTTHVRGTNDDPIEPIIIQR